MPYHTYPYEVPPLAYPYDAMEPYIDAETMRIHHDKHFAAYVDGLNKALDPYPSLQRMTLTQLLASPNAIPAAGRRKILQNAGGVYNHTMFFQGLVPHGKGAHEPSGRLLALINSAFGSVEAMKQAVAQAALGVFGSGWAVLALSPAGTLQIISLSNQETPVMFGSMPLLYLDVWEHAYYLKYQNRRAEYLQNIWNVLAFPDI